MISRLLELFEGPEAPGPWTPPAMPAALHALLPWRAFDESSELYVNAASTGFAIELPPFAGVDAENDDGSAAAAPPSEVLPEEPEGWFGQGELNLFGEPDEAREGAVGSGSPPASGADNGGEETDSVRPRC